MPISTRLCSSLHTNTITTNPLETPEEHAPSPHPLRLITLVPLPPPVTPGPKAAVIRMSRMTGCNVATLLDNKGGV